MKDNHSYIGLLFSIFIHCMLFIGIFLIVQSPMIKKETEQVGSISMEMMTAVLEPTATPELEEKEVEEKVVMEPEPTPNAMPKPKPKPKPKTKPKEKPKPKETLKKQQDMKPREKVKKAKPAINTNTLVQNSNISQNIIAPQTSQSRSVATENAPAVQTNTSGSQIAAYKAMLTRALQKRAFNTYPAKERLKRKTGIVKLSITVLPSGKLTNIKVEESSGNINLDKAAIAVAENTVMYKAPPPNFPNHLVIPISYTIQ